jgi:hypothetical protein
LFPLVGHEQPILNYGDINRLRPNYTIIFR